MGAFVTDRTLKPASYYPITWYIYIQHIYAPTSPMDTTLVFLFFLVTVEYSELYALSYIGLNWPSVCIHVSIYKWNRVISQYNYGDRFCNHYTIFVWPIFSAIIVLFVVIYSVSWCWLTPDGRMRTNSKYMFILWVSLSSLM